MRLFAGLLLMKLPNARPVEHNFVLGGHCAMTPPTGIWGGALVDGVQIGVRAVQRATRNASRRRPLAGLVKR